MKLNERYVSYFAEADNSKKISKTKKINGKNVKVIFNRENWDGKLLFIVKVGRLTLVDNVEVNSGDINKKIDLIFEYIEEMTKMDKTESLFMKYKTEDSLDIDSKLGDYFKTYNPRF